MTPQRASLTVSGVATTALLVAGLVALDHRAPPTRATAPAAVAAVPPAVAAAEGASLVAATEAGDHAAAVAALAAGADVNARGADGSTALMWAAYNGDLDARAAAHCRGRGPRCEEQVRRFRAVRSGDSGRVAHRRCAAQRRRRSECEQSRGRDAAHGGRAGRRRGGGADARGGRRRRQCEGTMGWPIGPDVGSAQSQPAMVEFLVAHGADVDARGTIRQWERKVIKEPRPKDMNQGGFTPLLYAAREGCVECAKAARSGRCERRFARSAARDTAQHGVAESAFRLRGLHDRSRRQRRQMGSLRPHAAVHRCRHEYSAGHGQRRHGRDAEHGRAHRARDRQACCSTRVRIRTSS